MPRRQNNSHPQKPEPDSDKPAIISSRITGGTTFRFTSGVSGTYMEDSQSAKQMPQTES